MRKHCLCVQRWDFRARGAWVAPWLLCWPGSSRQCDGRTVYARAHLEGPFFLDLTRGLGVRYSACTAHVKCVCTGALELYVRLSPDVLRNPAVLYVCAQRNCNFTSYKYNASKRHWRFIHSFPSRTI
jgi:hypothetical protein